MISLACAALALASTMTPAPINTQAEPARPYPAFTTPKSLVTVQGKSFEFKNDRTLGAQILEPSAPDIWQSLTKLSQQFKDEDLTKVKIKVFLYSESLTVARYQGKYTQDRTTLAGPERQAFNNSLKQFETLVRGTGFLPEITVTEDDDVVIIDNLNQAPAVIASLISPNVNDTKFLGDDPANTGPFDVIIGLTTAPLPEIWNGSLNESLLSVIPIHRVSPRESDFDLAAYLYNAVRWQLLVAPATGRLAVRTPVFPQAVTPSIDNSWLTLESGSERTPTPIKPLDPSFPLHNLPLDTSAYLMEDGTLALTGNALSLPQAFTTSGNTLPIRDPQRVLDVKGRIWITYATEPGTTLASLFKFTAPASQLDPTLPNNKELLPLIKPFGNFRITQPFAALSPTPNTYTMLGFQSTGGLELIANTDKPAIPDPSSTALEFTAKASLEEVLAINCYAKDGTHLGSIQITGPKQAHLKNFHRQTFNNEFFQTFHVPLTSITAPIYRVTFGPPPLVVPSNRLIREARQIEFSSAKFVPIDPQKVTPDQGLAIDSFDNNAPTETLLSLARSSDRATSIAALGILADQPTNEFVPVFGELTRSVNEAMAYVSAIGLARLKSDEAHAELIKTAQQGPFDFNRRVAAAAISKPGLYLDLGNLLFSARSWNTRVQAAHLLSLEKTEATQMYMVSSLFDPSTNVRGEIARRLDPEFPLSARRLLYLAVNDPSEDIRAICYTQLLKTKEESILKETLNGIKDESRLVRLAILSRTMANPDEKFRTMYQTAILDKDPVIQALVLKAFSQLPEKVVLGEVANVVGSKSEPVQLALLQLATAKAITLPTEELDRLIASPNTNISNLAKTLKGEGN